MGFCASAELLKIHMCVCMSVCTHVIFLTPVDSCSHAVQDTFYTLPRNCVTQISAYHLPLARGEEKLLVQMQQWWSSNGYTWDEFGLLVFIDGNCIGSGVGVECR